MSCFSSLVCGKAASFGTLPTHIDAPHSEGGADSIESVEQNLGGYVEHIASVKETPTGVVPTEVDDKGD